MPCPTHVIDISQLSSLFKYNYMKSKKQKSANKPVKRKRPELTEEQKAAIKKYFDEHPVSYTVECVGEYLHPDVKARLEERKKQQ